MHDVISPTLSEFTETVLNEFSFLQNDYNCVDISDQQSDPLTVEFQNKHCKVKIIGRSFGFALDVVIQRHSYDRIGAPYSGTFPLWCVLELRSPEVFEKRYERTSGQLKMIRMDAVAVKQTCADLLNGDFSIEHEVSARLERHAKKMLREDREYRDNLEHARATAKANEAFRAKDYAAVVEQLESVQDRLTKSQVKKLEYARKRAPRNRFSHFFRKK